MFASACRSFIDRQVRAVEKDADFVFRVLVVVQRYDRGPKGKKLDNP